MLIELNLDLTDFERDLENKKKIDEENKIKEFEKNQILKNLSNKYFEQLELVLVDT